MLERHHPLSRSHSVRLVGWLLLCALGLLEGDLHAADAARVEIRVLGPGTVRLRVAQGAAMPCDAAGNHLLVNGKFGPGQVVATSTDAQCVCVQQTHQPFVDVDWSPAVFACRPVTCSGGGKSRVCRLAPDPTIRIDIRSD